MNVTIFPLLGALHLRFPSYNAVSVRDAVAAFRPDAVVATGLEPDFRADPDWQATPEIVLPHTIVPWARARDLPVYGVHQPSPDPSAARDFQRYLNDYGKGQQIFGELNVLLRPLQTLLGEGLTLARIQDEVLPVIRAHQQRREELLEDGPGTDWLHERAVTMAERIAALPHERLAVLASIDHIPFLEDALATRVTLEPPPHPEPSEEARERSLLDLAFRVDVPEPGNVIARLREMTSLEARYHEANLLLANGHVAEALETLEMASRGDFSRPYYLPGYLLSRLGQLRDLMGERDGALRAYRGVRALDWVPPEALAVAEEGLEHPFGVDTPTS